MKIKLKIAGITLTYQYNYERFLEDKIKQYQIDNHESTKYRLEVIITTDIKRHPGQYRKAGNREYIFTNDLDVVCGIPAKDENAISQQVIFNKRENEIRIYINPEFFGDIPEQEYVMSGLAFLTIAQREGYLPLHASAFSFKGDAILFSAPSQTGKSTQARLWRERFPDEVRHINDDKPLLFEDDGTIYVAGTPFSGSAPLNENIICPLKALIFLKQGKKNEIVRLKKEEALPLFIQNILRPKEKEAWDKTFLLIERIMEKVPVYWFAATPEIKAVDAAYEVIYNGGK